MFDFLLKKNVMKLNLFLKLADQKATSISELSSEFSLPKNTLHRSLTILDHDISFVSNNTCSIQYHPKKITLKIDDFNSSLKLFHELKLYYLKQSPHFLLIIELITDGINNIDNFSSELFISNSHIYHLIRELNLQLDQFSLKILTSSERKMELSGNEFTLRAFSFRVINESFQLIEWPFNRISKDYILSKLNHTSLERINSLSENEENQILVYLAILDSRLSKSNDFPNQSLPPRALKILNILHEDAYLSEHIEDFLKMYSLQYTAFKTESLVFNIFLRLLIPSIFTKDQEERTGELLLNSRSSYFEIINPLCTEFTKTFNISDKQTFYHLYYSLTKYSLLMELIEISINALLNVSYAPKTIFVEKGKPDYLDVQFFLDNFIKSHKLNFESLDTRSKTIICNILYMYLNSTYHTNLKIYLHFSKNNFGEKLLAKKIGSHFNPSIITITNTFSEANLIISDSMEKEHIDKKYFYMYDINSQKLFLEVLFFITQHLISDSQED